MAQKRGRPKKAETERKTIIMRICVTPTERQVIEAAAQSEHMDMSVWVRTVILRAAEKGVDRLGTALTMM